MDKKIVMRVLPGTEVSVPMEKIKGIVSLEDVKKLTSESHEVLDISDTQLGMEEEYWEQILGYRHPFCAVIGKTGYRQVEVLSRLLEQLSAKTIILPDDVKRRHINRIIKNPNIGSAIVGENCNLFSMNGNIVMNKKGTKTVYNPNET